MRRPSLQHRVLWFVGLPVVELWIGAGLWLAQGVRHETAEMFDRELERTGASVLAMVASVPDTALAARGDGAGIAAAEDEGEGPRPEIVVRDRIGRVLLDASSLPPLEFDDAKAHFHSMAHAGETWRVYQRWDAARRHWIQVAAPLHDRDELLSALMQGTLLPLIALLLLLPLATWLGLRGGLAPLRSVSRSIGAQPARTPTLTRDDVPGELLQLTRAVDALVCTLDTSLARERRFTADAAHELRHPLSVSQLELDLAGQAGEARSRAQHLQRAREGLQRMQRLVTQLLTLARVESLEAMPDATTLSLAELVRGVVAEASEHAQPRGVQLSLIAADGIAVRGSAGLLSIAIHNLVDNAIVHGRAPGRVDIGLQVRDVHVELMVDDDGSGFPEEQAGRLGERFLRSGGSGSGLGLSIVHAIAALHGGSLAIEGSPLGGSRVLMRLPLQERSG